MEKFKQTKKVGLALASFTLFGLVVGATVVSNANNNFLGFNATGHVHNGYHYEGNGETEAYKYKGLQREFWTCCGCPEEGVWFTKPSTGTFVDRPLAQHEGPIPSGVITKAPWVDAETTLSVGSDVVVSGNVYTMPSSGSVVDRNVQRSISFLNPDSSIARRFFAFDVTISNGGWSGQSDLYVTASGNKDGKFVTGIYARLAYSSGASFHNPTQYIKSYNPLTGLEYGDNAIVVKGRRTEYVVDLSCLDDISSIRLYTDAGSTITVNSFAFKDTLCGHSTDEYESKSSIADGEYCASRTWKECDKCGTQLDFVESVPAAKETISLTNSISSDSNLYISGNTIYSTGAAGTGRWVSYNIPERFVDKGRLVVKLILNSSLNAFDVRLQDASGTNLAYNFGQIKSGDGFNNGTTGVTAVNDVGDTAYNGSNFLNHVITYTFDLSVLSTARVLAFGLWWGTQVLEINELYFEDICDHSSGNVVHVNKPASEYEDGCERDLCEDCGQIISTTSHVDSNKRLLNLPEIIPLTSSEYKLLNIFEHTSTRTKVHLKFTLEQKDSDGNWNYLSSNYGTYLRFYKSAHIGGQVGTGLYEVDKSAQTTFIQMNSNGFGDARYLSTNPNTPQPSASYGILPSFVSKSWDNTNKVATYTFDLDNSISSNICGISFTNSTADTRIRIFEAYQYIPA